MSRQRKIYMPTTPTPDGRMGTAETFRPSTFFTTLVKVPGSGYPGAFTTTPARRRDCDHCDEELRPATFAGVHYRSCPNACMSTYGGALSDHSRSLDSEAHNHCEDNWD